MPNTPSNLTPGQVAGASAAAGLAGAIPDNTSTTGNTNTSSQQDTTYNTGQTIDMNTFMTFLSQLMSQTIGSQTGSMSQNVTPTLSPEATAYMQSLMGQFSSQPNLNTTGYVANQTANINANSDAQRQAVDNIMASRGLSTSPAGAIASATIDQNRLNQITGMQQQAPLLDYQMRQANLANAANFFNAIPRGQQVTGTTQQDTSQQTQSTQSGQQNQQQTGTQTASGHQYVTGNQQTQSQQNQTSGGGIGGFFKGLLTTGASLLPFLSDERLKEGIKEIPQDKAIAKVRELKAREWSWKNSPASRDSGVLAQELEKSIPQLVHTLGDTGIKSVDYVGLVPYLIGAVQHVDKRVAELEEV